MELKRHLESARWFAGKGRPFRITDLSLLPALGADGHHHGDRANDAVTVRPVICEISYDDTDELEYYQLLLAALPASDVPEDLDPIMVADEEAIVDALALPAGLDRIRAAIVAGGTADTDTEGWQWHTVEPLPVTESDPIRPFAGEQSNSSVLVGGAIVKFFRRLELGGNPDVEVHAALGRRSPTTATLYASAEAAWYNSREELCRSDIAVALELLTEASDGWAMAAQAAADDSDFTEQAHDLGVALADVHSRLRRAFPTGTLPAAEIGQGMVQRLADTVAVVPELRPHAPALVELFTALQAEELPSQRVHGDFHLGQTLATPGGWRIIDFEGEPMKARAERLRLDTPWRDVAGMLRSFAYARTAASDEAAGDRWEQACRAAFLDGYWGKPLDGDEAVVLQAYEMDKAIYEVGYEAAHRPDWLHIPLAGVARQVDLPATAAAESAPELIATDTHTTDEAATAEGRSDSGDLVVEELSADPQPAASEHWTPSPITGWDLEGFHTGGDTEVWRRLGARVTTVDGVAGTSFTVWAPNAREVHVKGNFNDWDGSRTPMKLIPGTGVWGVFAPGVASGEVYKFAVHCADGVWRDKADPMAAFAESAPATGSIVYESTYDWGDDEWLEQRAAARPHAEPMSIYEVHLGSWRPGLTYLELADQLTEYVTWQGYTHVEFMPVAEHPYVPSWGYQVTGYFAPQSRLGTPDEFRHLVDRLHRAGIGVILDWVPGHFPKDEWALGRFDGTALYEHADPRQGEHRDWGTYIFNYGRNEVKSFLVSNALYWVSEFHIDGLRVDAVASMLYLDYSRQPGQWVPNQYGGNENLEAIDFLRYVNSHLYRRVPGVMMIAEESTSWPGVTRPVSEGGLGFGFKWNMGWMNDSLSYLQVPPIYRQYHHNELTFAMVYAFSENFILPISHDEVVHGKGSMLAKVPEDRWRQFATLRAFSGYMWSHPGKQLTFMGNEFGQASEFNEISGLEWWTSNEPDHRGLQLLTKDLNDTYRGLPAMWQLDNEPAGFRWLEADDASHNVFAYERHSADGQRVACITNFSPEPWRGYRLGLSEPGRWREIINTDDRRYAGTGEHLNHVVHTEETPWHGAAQSAAVDLPPLSCVWLLRED
ncbi:1,4-alpha-glucan branching enzyme [Parenemella sanctibonifatiensis]|uniref:1,4-alpha-glucan branching enzyme GlgB n=1 Tax=Parenemella sanctibonifatiensis TaxID=2016505 RepID=A0A255E4U7_9ACTN|nr:1,4-alpha-glucan branching enzyme [Parenemella sanctibonifatiensis]